MMEQNRKTLAERLQQFNSTVIPFMETREQGDLKDVVGRIVTICDYGFLRQTKQSKDPVAVLCLKEHPEYFYFAGQVITDQLRQLDDEGYHDEIIAEGIPVVFEQRKSNKTGNTYMAANYNGNL